MKREIVQYLKEWKNRKDRNPLIIRGARQEEKSSNAEVDFRIQHKNEIYPVEVKAGKTGTLKSIQVYLHEKKLKNGIRFNMDLPNIGSFETKINVPNKNAELSWSLLSLPLYMVSELRRLIDLKF